MNNEIVTPGRSVPRNAVELVKMLDDFHIDYKGRWQVAGKTKTLGNLIRSVELGEIDLIPGEKGLRLHTYVAVIWITSMVGGNGPLLLYEQTMDADGVWKDRPFPGSLGEKIMRAIGEVSLITVMRGMKEELGQTERKFKDRAIIQRLIRRREPHVEYIHRNESEFYPGLPETYERLLFECEIPPELHHEEYIYYSTSGQKIRFIWKKPTTA